MQGSVKATDQNFKLGGGGFLANSGGIKKLLFWEIKKKRPIFVLLLLDSTL